MIDKNLKRVFIAISMISIGTLSIGIKHKEIPISYMTKNERQLANQSSEKPTGVTSKANAAKPKKDYQQTVKEINNKKNIDNSDLNNFISNNSTFFLQILSSNKDINNMIKNVNDSNNVKTIQITQEQLKSYNQSQKNQIVATPGTIIFYDNGLITSQFDSNYSKDKNGLQQSYNDWVKKMLKLNNK